MPQASNRRNSDTRCSRCSKCCTSFVSLAFSTMGMIIAVVTYSALGGLLFMKLEIDFEERVMNKTRVNVSSIQSEYLDSMWNLTLKYSLLLQSQQDELDIRLGIKVSSSTNGLKSLTLPTTKVGQMHTATIGADNQTTDTSSPNTTVAVLNTTVATSVNYTSTTTPSNHSIQVQDRKYDDTNQNNDTGQATPAFTNVEQAASASALVQPKKNLSEQWRDEARVLTNAFQRIIHNKTTTGVYSWDGKDPGEPLESKWRYAQALLYAVSAITTIGYGHVTPKTPPGQLVTIVYCIIGLPLTFMCIAKLGHAFATAFRVIYHTCCCAVCCLSCLARKQAARQKGKKGSSEIDDTIGQLVIGPENSKQSSIVIGGKRYKSYTLWKIWKKNIEAKFEISLDPDTAVPTYLCIAVMAAYIAGGAFLFATWEGWRFREGAYFCFVTLTTIGFGDYVPGVDKVHSVGHKTNTQQQILCALYVLVGLAFIAMCFDLMQADVVEKVKWISARIGLSKPENAKTASNKRKEKVGLKLSCETLPRNSAISSNNSPNDIRHLPVCHSISNSLTVPSPTATTPKRMCVSMPTTPTSVTKTISLPSNGKQLPPLSNCEDFDIVSDSDNEQVSTARCSSEENHSLLRRESDIV